jgi:hypothetical protein
MKALVSAFCLLTFVAATTMPVQSYAQATGGTPSMAPDNTMGATAPKKSKTSSKKAHKSKKKSTSQTSSAKKKHNVLHASKHARHTTG